MGAFTENSAFGVTKNPYDLAKVSGGSSGGSAASVAANEAVFALGEDTGGSIRLPASFCGVVGLKPTYGTVSRRGVIALASSFDQVGPFAQTVADAKIVFEQLASKDEKDATSVDYWQKREERSLVVQNLRVGVPKEYFAKGLDPQIETLIKKQLSCWSKKELRLLRCRCQTRNTL